MGNIIAKRQRLARLINSRVNKAGLQSHVNCEATATATGISLFVKDNAAAVLASVGDKVPGGKFVETVGAIFWEVV